MPGSVQSIERAAAIIRLLSDSDRPLGLAQIARSLGLAKGTAHGLLKTMTDIGFVLKDESSGGYAPVTDLAGLAACTAGPGRLREVAGGPAGTLAARTRETVRVGVLRPPMVEVVHLAPGRPEAASSTAERGGRGSTFDATTCALGKVLLAHRAGSERVGLASGRRPADQVAWTTGGYVDLQAELAQVRARGWATDHRAPSPHEAAVVGSEAEGVVAPAQGRSSPAAGLGGRHQLLGTAGLAAPVRGAGGLVVAALGIDNLHGRPDDDDPERVSWLVAELCATAEAVSAALVPR